MIRYVRDANVCDLVEVFTNGSQLSPELNQKLVDSGLQRINISVEGLTEESYKRVADYNIDYQAFVNNIRDLYNRKDDSLSMYIKVVDHAIVKSEQETYYRSGWVKSSTSTIYSVTFLTKCQLECCPSMGCDKQNDLTEHGMYGQKINELKKVCPFPFMYLHINSDGSVAGCTSIGPVRF